MPTPPTRADSRHPAYVVSTPGLEPLVADELRRLGIRDAKIRHGGVGCTLTMPQLGLANLHLRTATRVLVRLATFPAPGFRELERGLRRIDWSPWLPAGCGTTVRASSTGSALFHTGAIEERAVDALGDRVVPGVDQTVLVRLQHDTATVSIDASGMALHKRGWRRAVDDAPLRETLAAALVMLSGWDGRSPLHDPFCGSGTIPIEAVTIARRMPPGRGRRFAFQAWPCADAVRWERLVAAADADVIDRRPLVSGSDASAHAVAAAHSNAAAAAVDSLVVFEQARAEELAGSASSGSSAPGAPAIGWLVTNPPYGARLGRTTAAAQALVDLAARRPRWRGAVIAPAELVDGPLAPLHPAAPAERVRTTNGGIPVDLAPFSGAGIADPTLAP